MEKITVEVLINSPIEKVWEYFNAPEHITKWASPSEDWHTTNAVNDVTVGGKFDFRMEAKDGSAGFNFVGSYDEVLANEKLAYTMAEGRKAEVLFKEEDGKTRVIETFDPENE